MNKKLEKTIKKTNGNLFAVFISIYDYMVSECSEENEKNFMKKVLEELKTSQDDAFIIDINKNKPKDISDYYDLIDKSELKINSIDDFKILCKMLHTITKKAVVCTLKSESKLKAKAEFLKQLEYIKYGIVKGNVNV